MRSRTSFFNPTVFWNDQKRAWPLTAGYALLWLLVLRMILSFYETDRPAALVQLPYLIWLLFAAYLNLGVWKLNG